MEFTEREKAIIETAVDHFRTDAVANGNFDSASDAGRVAAKIREWRDDDAILVPTEGDDGQ
jgi:hypothetical protein